MRRKKKGSAAFIVIMLMTIILILSFSLIPLTLSSVKQSNMLYGRNRTYYTGEGNMDKMLHYIDVFSERARISAYNKCFENGGPNLKNSYVEYIYRMYIPDEEDVEPELTYEEFKKKLMNYYKYEFNKGVVAFFDSNESKTISIVEGDGIKSKENVIYLWKNLQDSIDEYKINNESSNVKVEAFNNVDESSEFYRFKPKQLSNGENNKYLEEFSNVKGEGKKVKEINDSNILIYNYTVESLLRETFYISSESNDKTKRYLSLTVEFDPLGRDIPIKKEGDQIKKHDALTYGIICEDNLIVGSNLTVDSSVIVGGQGEPNKNNPIDSVEYGGILAGGNSGLFKSIDPALYGKVGEINDGNITIEKDAYVGELNGDGGIHGGFIETLGKGSHINIKGNSYSHSIVTHEGSEGGNINVEGSAFVADNISLNGKENNINIKKHLIGFEDGSSMSNNHLSSPAIVINKMDKSKDGKLTIGGQIALAGEGFVESLVANYEGKDVLFKTFETTAIYPNYISYSSFLSGDKFKEFYNQYQIKNNKDEDILPIDMFDKYSVMGSKNNEGNNLNADGIALKGIEFLLSYFTEYKDELFNYDMGKNSLLANNIKLNQQLNNITLDGKIEDVANSINGEGDKPGLNVSYFNYALYANGKMYLTRKPSDNTLLENAKSAIKGSLVGEDIILPDKEYSTGTIGGELNAKVFPAIKSALSKRLMLNDIKSDKKIKENDGTRLDRCFNWDSLKGDISIGTEESEGAFIKVSKGDIKLSEVDIENLKRKDIVFIASEGDVVIDAGENISIKGSIIAKGNIITKNNNVTITANEKTASKIANYKDDSLQEFLSKGIYLEGEKDTVEGITRTVKTNINIVNRRQLLE